MAELILYPRILAGNSQSEQFYIGGNEILAVLIPSAWDAASITWLGGSDGKSYHDLYTSSGFEIVTQTVAGKLAAVTGPGIPYTRIRSGTGSVPVSQSADRTLEVHVRER